MISPCFDKKLVEVLVSVAISTAVLCVASYLRVFRIQRKASYSVLPVARILSLMQSLPLVAKM